MLRKSSFFAAMVLATLVSFPCSARQVLITEEIAKTDVDRRVLVSVDQPEIEVSAWIRPSINRIVAQKMAREGQFGYGVGVALGELVADGIYGLQEANKAKSEKQKALEKIGGIKDAVRGFDVKSLANQSTRRAIDNFSWLKDKPIDNDGEAYRQKDGRQIVKFSYSYGVNYTFEEVYVDCNVKIYSPVDLHAKSNTAERQLQYEAKTKVILQIINAQFMPEQKKIDLFVKDEGKVIKSAISEGFRLSSDLIIKLLSTRKDDIGKI